MYILEFHERPMTANKYRTLHYHARADYDRRWRQAGHWMAKAAKVPCCEAIGIDVEVVWKRPSGPDIAACAETVKAIKDGIVDAEVIVDDRSPYIVWETYHDPVRGEADLLRIILTPTNPGRRQGWE